MQKNMALNTRKYEIFSLNCRSINRNWKSLKVLLLPCIPNCKILALSETWLNVPETVDARRQQEENYALDGYKVCLTNHGKGKGLATYYKADEFQLIQEINQYAIQIVKLRCNQFDFIHVYRSKSYSLQILAYDLQALVDDHKLTIICGDFNECAIKQPDNTLLNALHDKGFCQIVKNPTHDAGGCLDLVFFKKHSTLVSVVSVQKCHVHFSDHDGIVIHLKIDDQEIIVLQDDGKEKITKLGKFRRKFCTMAS